MILKAMAALMVYSRFKTITHMKSTSRIEPVEEMNPCISKRTWVGLFNSSGELVERFICDKEINSYQEVIDMAKLPAGNYIVIVQSPAAILTDKFEIS
jgi:hypothetical protein